MARPFRNFTGFLTRLGQYVTGAATHCWRPNIPGFWLTFEGPIGLVAQKLCRQPLAELAVLSDNFPIGTCVINSISLPQWFREQ